MSFPFLDKYFWNVKNMWLLFCSHLNKPHCSYQYKLLMTGYSRHHPQILGITDNDQSLMTMPDLIPAQYIITYIKLYVKII